jgi:Carboxypeptidase regulatory-like domain/TonB-dependent Receptor Plug Domain
MLAMRFASARRLLAAFLFFLVIPFLHAQYENGSVVGTIHDASGAAIAGAVVTITNNATGVVTKITANGEGDYEAPSLHVGLYTISASAPGFADAVADNITVSVGGRPRIDLSLKTGSTQATIQVTDIALQLETETSERGQVITNYQSEALPLVSRNYSDLLALVPGSRQAPTAATTSSLSSLVRAGAYNVNGQRSMFNNFLLDGLDNNAYGESNQGFDNQIIAVPPDSVAQFQVVTDNESAEYGRSSGATINVASQSGTNHLHATIYEFIRNTDLNAAGFFKPLIVSNTGATVPFRKPVFNRNQFGGNLGGPIIKDKLFFFLDYEGFRQVLKPLTVLTLPTQDELTGNLVTPVKNPTTGTVYAVNPETHLTAVPFSQFNPLSQQIVAQFETLLCPKLLPGSTSSACALPLSGVSSTGLASNDYAVQAPFTDNSDKGDLRLDWQINPLNSAFLRISDRKETGVNHATIPIPLDGQGNGNIRILDQQIVAGYTRLFGANKILDVRLGLDRTKAGKYNLSIGNTDFNNIPGYRLPTPWSPGACPPLGLRDSAALDARAPIRSGRTQP